MPLLLRRLKLPSFVELHVELAAKAAAGAWTFETYLQHLAEQELADRDRRRIERNLKQSGLPPDKTLATLDLKILPPKVRTQIPTLCDGGFIERSENLLAFGLPGRGKTHVLRAIGHELVAREFRVVEDSMSTFVCPQIGGPYRYRLSTKRKIKTHL